MTSTIRIGTRGSALAIAQTEMVINAMRQVEPSILFELQIINSAGDKAPDAPLASLGIGVFTTAIENALQEQHIDLAIHSLKDLPTATTPGLSIVPVLERDDPRDVLVSRYGHTFIDLPQNSRIGTSSPRRIAQLKHGRKDVQFIPIRGNIETRLKKVESSAYDGTVLAAAGVLRLGLSDQVTEYLSPAICAPAPGQAAIAAQSRSTDREILDLMKAISHHPTAVAVTAEREVLRAAGGGCQLSIGAHATVEEDEIRLFATVTPLDGSISYRVEVKGPASDPEIAGKAAYAELVAQGAGDLMHGVTR